MLKYFDTWRAPRTLLMTTSCSDCWHPAYNIDTTSAGVGFSELRVGPIRHNVLLSGAGIRAIKNNLMNVKAQMCGEWETKLLNFCLLSSIIQSIHKVEHILPPETRWQVTRWYVSGPFTKQCHDVLQVKWWCHLHNLQDSSSSDTS